MSVFFPLYVSDKTVLCGQVQEKKGEVMIKKLWKQA